MKRLISAIILSVIVFGLIAAPISAADPPDTTPELIGLDVYRNLIEDGDRLFLIYANTPYATPPDTQFDDTFIWQLKDGTTTLGSTVGYPYVSDGYGYQVFSMYFDAADSITWNPDTAYTLRLIGNPAQFDNPPVYNYTVTSSYYTSLTTTADNQAELTTRILEISDDLDIQWGFSTSLITEDDFGRTLSTFGQSYYRGAVYALQSMAPDLFPISTSNIEVEDREWSTTYATELQNQYSGTWVDTAKAAGATLFGTAYDLTSVIILFMLVVGIILANIFVTNDHWSGLIDAAFVMVIGARLALYDLGYLGLICALCIIWTGIKGWSYVRA